MRPSRAWNDTRQPYPEGQSVHGIFARVASRLPEKAALIDRGQAVSYRQLDEASDAYASALADSGVAPGDLVPVVLTRGAELITVILGLLKAGAAYALLDPAWPVARQQEIYAEMRARLVIRPARDAVGWKPTVWTPPGWQDARRPGGFQARAVQGHDPCCGFFSSGTTGRPKIVVSPHRGTVRLFRPGSFGRFDHDTIKPLAAALPWDGFTLELWPVLLNGGTSVIADEPYLTPSALRSGVSAYGVNTVFLSSGLFNMFVDEDLAAFGGVRQVMTGGERLSVPHVHRFIERYPNVTLINGYGPVETTVVASTHRVTPADCDSPDGIPIGRVAPDTQVYILDGVRECAVGEPGELHVAGDGLAIGYFGSPELTAERFPRLEVGGSSIRLYRTGDLGSWDEHGVLHYLGRIDRQVKVRGFRVEPAEVERQIVDRMPVRRCVVLARPDRFGSYGLSAFCIPLTPGDSLDGAVKSLQATLAPHHVPDMVVSVLEFPLTDNGKIDETALLGLLPRARTDVPEVGKPAGSQDRYVQAVAGIYADVLGLPAVSPDTGFRELGGNSLAAARVCTRLSAELARPVPVSEMLTRPTARALGHWLAAHPPGPAEHAPDDPPPCTGIPLTSVQAGFVRQAALDPDDRTAYCAGIWLVDGPVDADRLSQAIGEIHGRHEALRSGYRHSPDSVARVTECPAPQLWVGAPAPTAANAMRALHSELMRPLDLAAGRVWRMGMVGVGDGSTAVGYVVHHVAFDGWSEGLLARELTPALTGLHTQPLAQPATLAQSWQTLQRYLRVTDAPGLLPSWASELSGLPRLQLPGPEEDVTTAVPACADYILGEAEVIRLRKAAAKCGHTLVAVLLGGYARALATATGQDSFGVVMPIARRPDAAMEQAIGCHVNMTAVPVRAGCRLTTQRAGDLLEQALAAQYIEFGDLLAALDPGGTAQRPMFQTNFGYHDYSPAEELAGDRTARFFRQSHRGLVTPIQTEVWDIGHDRLRLAVYYQPQRVSRSFAAGLLQRFGRSLSCA